MGGPVAFGWRESGKISCHETCTGSIGLLNHPSFYQPGSKFFRRYAGSIAKKPPIPLAPSGYGLVFADFDSRRVFSLQNYSSPSRIHLLSAALDLDGGVIYDPPSYRETGKLSCLSEALRLGISPGAHGYDSASDSFRLFSWAEIGLDLSAGFDSSAVESMLGRVQAALRDPDPARQSLASLSAVIAPPGWSYLEIPESSPRPYQSLIAAMDQAGIPFSRSDAAAWDSFCLDAGDDSGDAPETPGSWLLSDLEARRIESCSRRASPRRKSSPGL